MKAAEKLGFRLGVWLREGAILGGRVVDTLLMDLVRGDYSASRGMEDHIRGPSAQAPPNLFMR